MSLNLTRKPAFELFEINILKADESMLGEISEKLALGLNLKEMRKIHTYFERKGRNPTDVELQILGQTWSEHCFHKAFRGKIITKEERIESLFKRYIASVRQKLKQKWLLSAVSEFNGEHHAGVIKFDEEYAIAAKVETHNHPSAVEPFGGAATGIGGVIRDILAVWAEPIACTNVLGFGPLDYNYEKLPFGIKHPKYLLRGVVAGIGSYGNNMGIPTVNGAVYFDESYVGNVVVYCGCIGLVPCKKFIRNTQPEDIILLAGGKTGRDGIHGVTFASAELTEKSEEEARSAVQIANPIEEEKLKRAIIQVRERGLGNAISDLGGGGLSSAVGEMAYRADTKCGAYVQLERIPLKYPKMAPWEIYISESQERMLLSIPEKNLKDVLEIFAKEDVEATPIGKFTNDGVLRIKFKGYTVAELDVRFLFNPPKAILRAEWKEFDYKEPRFQEPEDVTGYLLKLLSSPNIASKESIIRTYDHEVKGNTVIKPLQGKCAGPNDAAVLKPLNNSWKGIVISCGMNPNYGKIDSYWMAASNIDEAIRNNTAVGGRRIALLDNFTWGNPEKSDRLGSLVKACQACYDFAKTFETPFISGKDSLYNESPTGPVTPTLLITAVGIIPDVRKAVSIDLKQSGNPVYIAGQTLPELGGSEYYKLKGFVGKSVPKVRAEMAKRTMNALVKAIDLGYVRACHDLSEGGLAIAAAEMSFANDCGIDLWLKKVPKPPNMKRNDFTLFSESNSRFLIEVAEKHKQDFEDLMKGNAFSMVGKVKKEPYFCVYGLNDKRIVDISLAELRNAWKSTLGGG